MKIHLSVSVNIKGLRHCDDWRVCLPFIILFYIKHTNVWIVHPNVKPKRFFVSRWEKTHNFGTLTSFMLFIQFWMFSKDFSSVMSYTRIMPWRGGRIDGDKETGRYDSAKGSEWTQRSSDAKLIIQSACSVGFLFSPWLLCSTLSWWS